MRRTSIALSAALLVGVAVAPSASADVTDTTVVTTVAGLLTLTGTGASLSVDATPGTFSPAVGGAALAVSDLRGGTAGWKVTATYSEPATGTSLGGENMKVSATSVTTEVLNANVNPAVDQLLSSPVTVATTGTTPVLGLTEFVASYKIQAPSTASVGQVFGGVVTYTIASVE